MKLILVVLLGVIASAVVTDVRQGSLFENDFSERFQQSHLGQAILLLMEMKSNSAAVDFSSLWAAIDELKQSIEQRKIAENSLYEKDHQQYVSDLSFYTNKITQHKNEVASFEVDISDLEEARKFLELNLATTKEEQADTQ